MFSGCSLFLAGLVVVVPVLVDGVLVLGEGDYFLDCGEDYFLATSEVAGVFSGHHAFSGVFDGDGAGDLEDFVFFDSGSGFHAGDTEERLAAFDGDFFAALVIAVESESFGGDFRSGGGLSDCIFVGC